MEIMRTPQMIIISPKKCSQGKVLIICGPLEGKSFIFVYFFLMLLDIPTELLETITDGHCFQCARFAQIQQRDQSLK